LILLSVYFCGYSIGVSGIADVRFLLLDRHDLVNSLVYAANHNVWIINASFNYEYLDGSPAPYNSAHSAAISNYNGLLICAASNENINNDITPRYPTNYSDKNNVISVGAIKEDGNRWSGSNYGENSVSIFAPGEFILTTTPHNAYTSTICCGTSMAAPHVTGTAALMLNYVRSKSTNMSTAEISAHIKSVIIDTATKYTALSGLCVSGGRLNAQKCLERVSIRTRAFSGFGYSGSTYYWNGKVDMTVGEAMDCNVNSSNIMVFTASTKLSFLLSTNSYRNAWNTISGTVSFQLKNSAGEITQIGGNDEHVSTVTVPKVNPVSLGNTSFTINTSSLSNDTYTLTLTSKLKRSSWTDTDTKTYKFIVDRPAACVDEGTLITLADGSQVAIENLTGDENLLVWNLETGSFDIAPMMFIDSDPYTEYEIIHAYFSDGTEVKVIDEHAFWDIDLNKYVFFRDDADKYIGHWYNKQSEDSNGNMTYTAVQLIDVVIYNEYTTAWSPVTYGHLCFYVNGMLSMPGATEGLINIFNVNAETMKIDEVAYQSDVEEYGLFTYEEFSENHYIPEVVFDAFNIQYFKISMGKGLLDWETIEFLINRYSTFFDMEETDVDSNQSSDSENINNDDYNHGGNGNHCGHHNHNGRHNNNHRNGCSRRNGYYYNR